MQATSLLAVASCLGRPEDAVCAMLPLCSVCHIATLSAVTAAKHKTLVTVVVEEQAQEARSVWLVVLLLMDGVPASFCMQLAVAVLSCGRPLLCASIHHALTFRRLLLLCDCCLCTTLLQRSAHSTLRTLTIRQLARVSSTP